MADVKTSKAGYQKNQFLYEYVYYKCIDFINTQRKHDNKPLIMVSQAKAYRKQLSEELARRGADIGTVKPQVLRESINNVLMDANDGQPFFTEETSKQLYTQYFNEYLNITGFSSNKGTMAVKERKIPVSPYHPNYATKECVMQHGSQLLYADLEAFPEIAKVEGIPYGEETSPRFYKGYVKNSGIKYKEAGLFTTAGDKSGMARLLPFIPKDDYNKLASWVNQPNENMYMSEKALDRSVAIMSYLADNGYEYSVQRDNNPGQLKVNIDGTKINVRIMETRNHENYVGRVYDDGISYRFSKTKSAADLQLNIQPDDCVNILKFAMGESVNRKDLNQPVGRYGTYVSGIKTNPNSYYRNDGGYTAIYSSIPNTRFDKMTIYVDNTRQNNLLRFSEPADAETYLRGVIHSARESFEKELDVDTLIKEVNKHKDDEQYSPKFSGNDNIAAIQHSYWEILTGKQSDLLKPGVTLNDYKNTMNVISTSFQGDMESSVSKYLTSDMFYEGTSEEKVRAHAMDMVNSMIGQFDRDEDGLRFDPANVANYMESGNGIYRNNDNLLAAMKKLDLNPDELKGNAYNNNLIKNRMIKFNPNTAKPMNQISHPFVQTMYQTIAQTLEQTGCDVNSRDILMDDNGIVQYKGTRTVGWDKARKESEITGQIGQIFVPDDLGMVETRYAGSENYIFVPGYTATVVPQKEGENLSLEERTRLHGYEQIMKESIAHQIRSDLMTVGSEIGTTTSINSVHHQTYDTRYPIDVIQRAVTVDGMSKDVFDAIIKTLSRRVRYSNEFKEGSTINADYQANRDNGFQDLANDNYADPYRLSGRRNMSVMTEDAFGYFDPMATSTSTNQGIVRFLTESTKVTPDGRMIKGDENDKTPIMKIDEMRYADYSPFDRNQMVFSNLLTARAIANNVYVAQMTFGGWGFDDGYVVSKEFAEKYQIRDTEGNLRPMVKGDKICDFGGNKGVISLVVDRELHSDVIAEKLQLDEDSLVSHNDGTYSMNCKFKDVEYAITFDRNGELSEKKQAALQIQDRLGYKGCDTAIEWFEANPDLEVVGAPFPAVSRFNATSDKMLMEHPTDLISPKGEVLEGCMGTTSFIITDMPVDEKTHNYGDEEIKEGKGRKASSQLAWVLASKGCTEILKECYGTNSSATTNLREILITMGLDMDEVGNLRDHYEPHEGERRNVFEMPQLVYRGSGDNKVVDTRKMRQEFNSLIKNAGGVLEMPFPLTYPTGAITPPLNDGKTDVVYTKQEWERKGYTRKDGVYVRPTTVHRKEDVNTQRTAKTITYGLPILSSYLRSGQEFEDGTVSRHDYTTQYQAIFDAAVKYRAEMAKGENANQNDLKRYQADAQRCFEQITVDLQERKFDNNKHNIFKDTIMSNRLSHSATAVWTADPRLDIDQIAIGPETAKALDVKDGDYILTWRDPMLRDAGVVYMRVKIDPTLIGVAINPAMDKPYEGDFDGDSIGLAKLMTESARKEAMDKFTVGAKLLDYGALYKDENGNDHYKFILQDGLDLASAHFARPELKARREKLEDYVNAFESDNTLSAKELRQKRAEVVKELSAYVKDSFGHEYGTDMMCYKDAESHLKGICHVVDDGAKGNYKKLQDYMKYMGYTADMIKDENGKPIGVDFTTLKDVGHTLATYADAKDTMYATAIKAYGTGVAGKYSQRGMSALRDVCPKAVLETTYPNTQGVLQAKHDPIDARHRYEMLMTTARDLWRGYKLDEKVDMNGITHWKTVREPDTNKPMQATPEEFKSQFLSVYGKNGLDCDINPYYVDDIANALTDASTGRIINMEQEIVPNSSTLDRLTYGGGFEALKEAAQNNENLFEGKYTQHFAPNIIQRNIEAKEGQARGDEDVKSVKAIVKSDVKETTEVKRYKTDKAVAVGGHKVPVEMQEIEQASNSLDAFSNGDLGDN